MGRLIYTPHPPGNGLQAFAPQTLIKAVENTAEVEFAELLEMRRVVEEIAGDIEKARPDLIPFFATGGIPFMIPAMQVLGNRRAFDLVDGTRFHMFPGLSWNGKQQGVNSETFFAREFGKLIESATHEDGCVHIWTLDATFTGNAIRKLLISLHRTFDEFVNRPAKAIVTLVAVIDASRADRETSDEKIPLHSPCGIHYLLAPADLSPVSELHDHQTTRFVRNQGDELFELNVEYRVVGRIPTEDRAELIGAKAKKDALGISSEQIVGRLTVKFENGYTPSGTGGGSLGSNIISYLATKEESLPWSNWLETAAQPRVDESEQEIYAESKLQSEGGLTIFEAMFTPTEELVAAYLSRPRLLDGAEIHCLKERAHREFSGLGGVQPTSLPTQLLKKVVASAKAADNATSDALKLLCVCRLEKAAEVPIGLSESESLEWRSTQLKEEPRTWRQSP